MNQTALAKKKKIMYSSNKTYSLYICFTEFTRTMLRYPRFNIGFKFI